MAKLDEILNNPAEHFNSPTELVAAEEFSREQKIDILRRWDDDARLLLTAQSEGMRPGKSSAGVLTDIQAALAELGADVGDT